MRKCNKPITVFFEDDKALALRVLAAERDMTRSQLVREAVDNFLKTLAPKVERQRERQLV